MEEPVITWFKADRKLRHLEMKCDEPYRYPVVRSGQAMSLR